MATSYFDKRLQPWAEKNLLAIYGIRMDDDHMYLHKITMDPCNNPSRIIEVAKQEFNAIQCYYRPDQARCYFLRKEDADNFHTYCSDCLAENEAIHQSSTAVLRYPSEVDFRSFLCRAFDIEYKKLDDIIAGESAIDQLLEGYAYPDIEKDIAFAKGCGLTVGYDDDRYSDKFNSVYSLGKWVITCGKTYGRSLETYLSDVYIKRIEHEWKSVFYFFTESELNIAIDYLVSKGYRLNIKGDALSTSYAVTEIFNIDREPNTQIEFKPYEFKKWVQYYKEKLGVDDEDSGGIEVMGNLQESKISYDDKKEALIGFCRSRKIAYDRTPNGDISLLLPTIRVHSNYPGVRTHVKQAALDNDAFPFLITQGGTDGNHILAPFFFKKQANKAIKDIQFMHPSNMYTTGILNLWFDIKADTIDMVLHKAFDGEDMDHIIGSSFTDRILELELPSFNEWSNNK